MLNAPNAAHSNAKRYSSKGLLENLRPIFSQIFRKRSTAGTRSRTRITRTCQCLTPGGIVDLYVRWCLPGKGSIEFGLGELQSRPICHLFSLIMTSLRTYANCARLVVLLITTVTFRLPSSATSACTSLTSNGPRSGLKSSAPINPAMLKTPRQQATVFTGVFTSEENRKSKSVKRKSHSILKRAARASPPDMAQLMLISTNAMRGIQRSEIGQAGMRLSD